MVDAKSPTTLEGSNATLTHNQKKAGFWTRGKKIGCAIGVLTFIVLFLVVFLPILFFVIGPKVAKHGVESSVLTFTNSGITNPTNTSFDLDLNILVTDAGKSKATISHTTPMTVFWINPLTKLDVPILSMALPPFKVSGGKGTINTSVKNVTVLSQEALTMFNKFLIGGPAIQWKLVSGISVRALGRNYGGIEMNKVVTLAGMRSFQNTTIREFALPGYPATANDTLVPIVLNATLINPSPVGLELDETVFAVSTFGSNIALGTATSAKAYINAMGPTKLSLTGNLNALTAQPEIVRLMLAAVLGGKANIDVVVTPISVGGANPVSWISGALVGAHLNATMGRA